MAHASATAEALNAIIKDGVRMYTAITVGATTYFVLAKLVGAHAIQSESAKFRIGLRTAFNDKEYLKMTDLYKDMVALGHEMFDVELDSKNFDCWGRFHILLPLEGKWQSTPLRRLLTRNVRQGTELFDLNAVKFRHAVEVHSHLKDATDPIFAVAATAKAKASASSEIRQPKRTADDAGLETTLTPPKKLLTLLEELRTALDYLTNSEGKPLKQTAKEVVERYPTTSTLRDLLGMDAHEATSLMAYAKA